MKVVQINVTYGNADSTGRNVKELHDYLLDNGVDSYVYAAKVNDDSVVDDRIHFFSSRPDRTIHAFLSRLTGLQGYFSWHLTRKLVSELLRLKPDVVLLHVLHSNCINFPILCRYLTENDIPTILVLHDCWYFTGHCCYFTQSDCVKWQQDCCYCPQIHQWNKSWFFDTAHKCLRDKEKWFEAIPRLGVVGVSDWITGEAKKSILKDAAIIQRIYNWIDLETFRPRDTRDLRKQLGITENEKVLLGVASAWGERKGLQEMLLAAKSIPDSKVVMIGKMPEDIEIPENMICAGLVRDPAKLSEYYSMADVFLNPSVQETFGKTTAEAMSCGTPVIVYNTTACTELVGTGCGKVVGNMEISEYLSAVQEYLRKPKNSSACRQFAENNFAYHDLCSKYMECISQLYLAQKRRTGI